MNATQQIENLIRRVEKMTEDVRKMNAKIEAERERVYTYRRELTKLPEVFDQS